MYYCLDTVVTPSISPDLPELANRIEDSIVCARKEMRVKNLRMFKAKQNIRNKHHQEEQQREELRENLEKKMQSAEQQLEKLMLSKSKEQKSRQDAR